MHEGQSVDHLPTLRVKTLAHVVDVGRNLYCIGRHGRGPYPGRLRRCGVTENNPAKHRYKKWSSDPKHDCSLDGVVGVLRSLTAGHWNDRPAHITMQERRSV